MIHSSFRPDGGMDIMVSLTAEEIAAIGSAEAEGLADWFDTALWGQAMLRTPGIVLAPGSSVLPSGRSAQAGGGS
ncbi:hypothetical protein ACFZC7_35410 [Streptomyces massasporeus]|uniref:hypothetical protein n=1 Tax=Streptomyces massasporeus TaxID=67324 RepID=UPI0036E46C7B